MTFIRPVIMHPTEIKKQFSSKLKSLSGSRSPHQVFSDWLEIAAIALHQLPYQSGELPKDNAYEALEAQYLERVKAYKREELNSFSEMLSLLIVAHNGSYSDFLGDIAGEYELLNKHVGQFFTPYHLCRFLAKLLMGNMRSLIEEKGVITVCEPASGAGGLVIACAEEIASQGIDPCAHVQFDCTDISRDAFNMAYVQLSALGLQAIVRHGNTLSGECWESRPTPQLRLFQQWLAPRQKTQRLVSAMRSLLTEAATPTPAPITTLVESEACAAAVSSVEKSDPPQEQLRQQPQADIVLDRQMSLFDL